MASKLVLFISELGWRGLSSLRDTIKLLFNVDISLSDGHFVQDGSQQRVEESEFSRKVYLDDSMSELSAGQDTSDISHQILMETYGPPENIEKAQKFAISNFPSNSSFKKVTLQLQDLHRFETIHRHSTHIQQSTASLLKFNSDDLELSILGHEHCVELARKEVKMILEDQNSRDSSYTFGIHSVHNSVHKRENPIDNKQIFHENRISNTKEITESCIETDAMCILDNISSSNRHHWPLNQKSSSTSSSIQESDDDNNVVVDPLTDSRNSKQVEQAVKLGYSFNQIESALEKLGPGCSSDNLLAELIKIGNEESQNKLTGENLVNCLVTYPINDLSLASNESRSSTIPRRSSPVSAINNLNASDNLRSIVIDGSNVAMSHGQDKFSCKGIKIVVDWFRKRGHKDIHVFVPAWRKEASRPDAPIEDQQILLELEREKVMSFTPARRVQGRRLVCYDDRFVLNHAIDSDGIIVSNDVYRDLVRENEKYRKIVEQRLLMYTFVKDKFMPPDDPLGRHGPSLDDFLRKVPSEQPPKPQDCPYGKKCTYGNKCRFYHPERGFVSQKSISETLKEQANINLQEIATKRSDLASEKGKRQKQKLARTKSLVPGQPLPLSFSAENLQCESGQRQKLKLCHSKSLISPMKSADYLTASRLKLEEAESMDSYQTFLPPDKNIGTLIDSTSPKVQKHRRGSEDILYRASSSPRGSPRPSRDLSPLGGVANINFQATGVTDNPIMTLSHLAVPPPQPAQESYSSGHLSVAKKLSDEGSEKSFFLESKSTPSPPSSLLDEISAYEEQKITNQKNLIQEPKSSSQDPPRTTELIESQCLTSRPDSYQNQSINDTVHSQEEILSPISGLPSFDSGNFSMYGSPQPQTSPHIFSNFFLADRKEVTGFGKQHLQRSLSSSHTLKGPENTIRRSSDAHLKSQRGPPSYPFNYKKMSHPTPAPGTLLRLNSSSNPEIHSMGESCDSGKGLDSGCGMYHSAPLSGVINPAIQDQSHRTDSKLQRPISQHSILQTGNQFAGASYSQTGNIPNPGILTDGTHNFILHSYPSMSPTTYPGNPYNFSPTSQRPMVPLQAPPNRPFYFSYPMQQGHSPFIYSSDIAAPSYPSFQNQAMFQGHSYRQCDFQPSPGQGPHPQYKHEYQQPTHSANAVQQPTFINQEAPIHPQDSRYAHYHHLSPVFGERVVRTFMNRNPDVKDIDQLITLIPAYKVETGM